MQRAYRYLITAVGWTWRLQGHVAWSAVAPLLWPLLSRPRFVLLFVVFRQGMGTLVAGALAVVLALSPLHLSYLAHLRDYSKAPFVLGLVVSCGPADSFTADVPPGDVARRRCRPV